jgi:hypothetical protein
VKCFIRVGAGNIGVLNKLRPQNIAEYGVQSGEANKLPFKMTIYRRSLQHDDRTHLRLIQKFFYVHLNVF